MASLITPGSHHALEPGGSEGVFEQTGDGHGSGASRHGRDRPRHLLDGIEVDVTHDPGLGTRNTDIDDGRPR